MALFVLGAGATRGCSFVDVANDPCLPPLDADFFTQLQRVQGEKHQSLISAVMKDVVEIFGTNFEVTMETVFSTLEHCSKMLDTTKLGKSETADELKKKRDRLRQAIAVVLESSLTQKVATHSTRKPRKCDDHDKLVQRVLKSGDEIITFNYDCVIDDSLKRCGDRKWHAKYGYGFPLGPGGKNLKNEKHWQPKYPATDKVSTIKLYKLHGSLHFQMDEDELPVTLKERPYTKQKGNLIFSIIPPESHKNYAESAYANLWRSAAEAIKRAKHIIVIGYSLPATDLHSSALFRTSVKPGGLRSLVVVNPDQSARKRCRTVLQAGLTEKTRILSFDKMGHFLRVERRAWERPH